MFPRTKQAFAVLSRVFHRNSSDRIALIAAGVAFFALLALFPGITALVAVAGLMLDPTFVSEQITPFVSLLPESAAAIILGQITAVVSTQSDNLSLAATIALVIAFYSASAGTTNLVQGLNVAYGKCETRGFMRRKFTVLMLTLFLLFFVLITLIVVAGIPVVFAFLPDWPILSDVVTIARWPVLFLLGMGGISVLYRIGPCRSRIRWRWLAPGSFVACLLWLAGTIGFDLYVRYFGSYNETFGALGGVIILLTWLWLTAYVTLLGAVIDAEIDAQLTRNAQTKAPRLKE